MKQLFRTFVAAMLFFTTTPIPACNAQQAGSPVATGQEQTSNMDSMLLKMMAKLDTQKKQDLMVALSALKWEKPDTRVVRLNHKTVEFIPMVHAGQGKFYEQVKAVVSARKKNGYVVFYEQIKRGDPTGNGAAGTDTMGLKFRKIIGLEPTRKMYSLLKMAYPDIVIQPAYDSLGITNTDVNADVTVSRFVEQYEMLYGKVQLDSCDLNTPAGSLYFNCGPRLPDASPIIETFRNKNLAAMIKDAPYPKILVIYGARHITPVIELISK